MMKYNEDIKIGDIFFVDARDICAWGSLEIDEDHTYEVATWNEEEFSEEMVENPIYIAVKYIGDGVIQEMTTKEKIVCYEGRIFSHPVLYGELTNDFSNEDCYYVSFHFDDSYKGISSLPLTYNAFIEYEYGSEISEYINRVKDIELLMANYPLVYNAHDSILPVTEETKKLYLKHDDEERKELIYKIKEKSLVNTKKLNDIFDKEIKKISTLTDEDIKMAYLDNSLYDFENEGKRSK